MFSDCTSDICRPLVYVQLNQNYCGLMVLSEPPLTQFEELPTVNFANQFIWLLHWQFFLNILLVWTFWGWKSQLLIPWNHLFPTWGGGMRNLSIVDGQSVYHREETDNVVCCSHTENSSQSEPHWWFSSLTIKAITLKIQFSFSVAGKERLLRVSVRATVHVCSAAQPGIGELVTAAYSSVNSLGCEINTCDFRVKIC